MNLTVLICTCDRPSLIKPCVQSILDSTYREFELVVVDQSGNDETKNIMLKIQNTDSRVKYYRMEGKGKTRALNFGIKKSSGDIFATTDDDCTVDREWLQNIINAFEKKTEVDLIFGQIINRYPYFPDEDTQYTDTKSIGIMFRDGANRSFRRSLYDKLGGFDELLGPGAPLQGLEDLDFAYRTLKKKSVMLVTPKPVVTHVIVPFLTPDKFLHSIKRIEIGRGALLGKIVRSGSISNLGVYFQKLYWRLHSVSKYLAKESRQQRSIKPVFFSVIKAWSAIILWNLSGFFKSFGYSFDRHNYIYRPKN